MFDFVINCLAHWSVLLSDRIISSYRLDDVEPLNHYKIVCFSQSRFNDLDFVSCLRPRGG